MVLEDRRLLATFTVTSVADTLTGGSPTTGTLRWAVDLANEAATSDPKNPKGNSTIAFDPTVFANPQTIVLTRGPLELSNTDGPTKIIGSPAGVAISGGGNSRVFLVDKGVRASLSGLTIMDGSSDESGGGLVNHGSVTLDACTISGNSAEVGGGLANYNTVALDDCTISGNSAELGGGLFDDGPSASLVACTISRNTATQNAGGVAIDAAPRGSFWKTQLTDTIVAGNSSQDILVPTTSPEQGENTIKASNDLLGTGGDRIAGTHNTKGILHPELSALGDYGGPTPTMALLSASPAIGAGETVSGIETDQRGLMRGERVDIGAFQTSLVVESTAGTVVTTASSLTLPGAVNLADKFAGAAITFDPTAFTMPRGLITLSGSQLELRVTRP